MNVYDNVHDLIGNTPIVKINQFNLPKHVHLYAKLEFYNPGGSIKDRIGKWIIDKAEKEGQLKKGMTIIEATAGNTGIGIALAALNKSYEVIFVVPDKFSEEKQILMKALGAKIINTPKSEGLLGAYKKIEEIKQKNNNLYVVDQFNNLYNPETHYFTTGREIYHQLNGKVDVFVSGAGSGGTFTGVMNYLKEKDSKIKGILADPVGSIIGGGNCGSYEIEGIGNDFIPKTMDKTLIDEVVKVTDANAFQSVKELALREGLLVGSSSGAAFYAALSVAKRMDKGNILVIFPDRADRYLSQNIYREIK